MLRGIFLGPVEETFCYGVVAFVISLVIFYFYKKIVDKRIADGRCKLWKKWYWYDVLLLSVSLTALSLIVFVMHGCSMHQLKNTFNLEEKSDTIELVPCDQSIKIERRP